MLYFCRCYQPRTIFFFLLNENMKRKENGFENHFHQSEKECLAPSNVGKLYSLKSVPSWLQFNKFILHGYRAQLTTQECLSSLLHLHNETVNIYSHGIPMFLALALVPATASQACLSTPFWFSLHYFACFAPFFASPVYHLFMCHRSGGTTYYNLLTFDMCGVWAVNAFGGLCGIRATLYCFPFWRILSLTIYMTVSLTALYFVLLARTPKQRFVPLMSFGLIRYFFLAVRLLIWRGGHPCGSAEAVPFYAAMDLLACLGGLLNVSRFPERLCPGLFDVIGNSHQIMHILTTVGVACLHFGAMEDFSWMDDFSCGNRFSRLAN